MNKLIGFFQDAYFRDKSRIRSLKRWFFYKIEPYEYFRLEECRNRMLKVAA